jgi:tetratricopeptide (TPR) repeat protein
LTNAPSLDPDTLAAVQGALAQARRGDLVGARTTAETALALGKDKPVIQSLLGMFCAQAGDFTTAIQYLRAAWTANPSDVGVASNLAKVLMDSGAPYEALDVCSEPAASADPSLRLWRLRAYLLQQLEDYGAAATAYERVVAGAPDDFEAWNNLGNSRTAHGDPAGSVAALEKATALRPDVAPVRMNLAAALGDAGRTDDALAALAACARDFPYDSKPWAEQYAILKELGRADEALEALEKAVAIEPNDVDLLIKLGAERSLAWNMSGAEEGFRRAIKLDLANAEAFVALANLLEHTNQTDAFAPLIAQAEEAGLEDGSLNFIRALSLRRDKKFEEGLAALALVPDDVEPARQSQLLGQFNDRLGRADIAFPAFARMNELQKPDPSDPVSRAEEYRAQLTRHRSIVNQDWYCGWTPPAPSPSRPTPAFLVGFPRSGTTLLDTMLMGHSRVAVLEERPPLSRVEQEIGEFERMASLSAPDIEDLRTLYFSEAAKYADLKPDTLLIDKFPLHLNKVPIIHRLFPDAQFILALRHPCDVLLSCFMSNFRLNNAMANFLNLETAAWVYDQTFSYWHQCNEIMPIKTHTVMYERMIADSEAELRPLFDALGLDWRADVLDHRKTAAGRGVISTASYSQVHEPLYDRANGRWTRYREHLAPILPVLKPWVERFGYSL